jgi:Mg2+/Co2+ transporter CorC
MPRRGESATVGEFEFRVQRTDRRRIDSLRVTVPSKFEPTAPSE